MKRAFSAFQGNVIVWFLNGCRGIHVHNLAGVELSIVSARSYNRLHMEEQNALHQSKSVHAASESAKKIASSANGGRFPSVPNLVGLAH
jgi:hypothetical protein